MHVKLTSIDWGECSKASRESLPPLASGRLAKHDSNTNESRQRPLRHDSEDGEEVGKGASSMAAISAGDGVK